MAVVWFYIKNGQRLGPLMAGDLKNLAEAGELVPEDLLWKEGMAGWEQARSVKGLFEARPQEPHPGAPAHQSPYPTPPPPPPFDSRATDFPEPPGASSRSFFGSIWFGLPTFLLALAAFILALMSAFRGNPVGKGLRAYDLSKPESAVRSLWEMKANHDLLAEVEAKNLRDDPKEALSSLSIKETLEVDVNGRAMKIVLFSYKRNGKEKHDHWGFVKHPTRDAWINERVPVLDTIHPKIAQRLREWQAKEFNPDSLD